MFMRNIRKNLSQRKRPVSYTHLGGKVIIVDPRVTPAVDKLADIHLQLRPGTDGALALGMAKIIIENGWQDQEFIDKHTYGYEDYAAYVKQWDLEKVARITGLNPDDISVSYTHLGERSKGG